MRAAIIGIILVILVAAGLGAGYLVGAGNRETVTSVSTSLNPTTLTSIGTSVSTSVSTSTVTSIGTSTLTSVSTSTLTSEQTVVSTATLETTATSTITSTVTTEQPIPAASVETANISIGGSPGAIAVDPNASRIYVADGSSVTVIDASSHSVIDKITLPASSNNAIAVDDSTKMVYVLVEGGVAEINGTTNKVVGELSVNFGYQSLAYDPSTHVLYGSPETLTGGTLVGVNAQTGATVANVSLGFWAASIAVNPYNNMVYAVGCVNSFVCGSTISIVNGTSEALVTTVHFNSAYYSKVTVDPKTDVVYVSGEALLAALNGINGEVIYSTNPQTCGPFLNMADIPSSNQVLAVLQNYDYLMVYDGGTVTLANMYSFSSSPQSVAYNPDTNELYVTLSGYLLAFQNVASTGHVDGSLVGSGQACLPP